MKIIQRVPLDRKCTLGVTPALGDAHCTGAWRTAPGAMHWYRGLYALVPEFINGAPRIRSLSSMPPAVWGAVEHCFTGFLGVPRMFHSGVTHVEHVSRRKRCVPRMFHGPMHRCTDADDIGTDADDIGTDADAPMPMPMPMHRCRCTDAPMHRCIGAVPMSSAHRCKASVQCVQCTVCTVCTMTMHTHNVTVYNVTGLFIVQCQRQWS